VVDGLEDEPLGTRVFELPAAQQHVLAQRLHRVHGARVAARLLHREEDLAEAAKGGGGERRAERAREESARAQRRRAPPALPRPRPPAPPLPDHLEQLEVVDANLRLHGERPGDLDRGVLAARRARLARLGRRWVLPRRRRAPL